MSRTDLLVALVLVSAISIAVPAAAQEVAVPIAHDSQGAQQPPQRTEPSPPRPITPQGFSVVLVLGHMQTDPAEESVPPGARKALADMKDFLPFKGYHVLDVQWTICCGSSPMTSRLRGPQDQEYELELHSSPSFGPRKVSVRFVLKETLESASRGEAAALELSRALPAVDKAAADLAQAEQAFRRADQLHKRYLLSKKDHDNAQTRMSRARASYDTAVQNAANLRAEINDSTTGLVQGRFAPLNTVSASRRPIIDTSFTMEIGETVVVGTSRLKGGDKALIALLTAVPPKSPIQ